VSSAGAGVLLLAQGLTYDKLDDNKRMVGGGQRVKPGSGAMPTEDRGRDARCPLRQAGRVKLPGRTHMEEERHYHPINQW
jgi:hypothetical protein